MNEPYDEIIALLRLYGNVTQYDSDSIAFIIPNTSRGYHGGARHVKSTVRTWMLEVVRRIEEGK